MRVSEFRLQTVQVSVADGSSFQHTLPLAAFVDAHAEVRGLVWIRCSWFVLVVHCVSMAQLVSAFPTFAFPLRLVREPSARCIALEQLLHLVFSLKGAWSVSSCWPGSSHSHFR